MVPFLHVLVYSFFPIRTACPIQVPELTVVAVFVSCCTAKKPCIQPTQCNCVVLPFPKLITGPVIFLLSQLAAELTAVPPPSTAMSRSGKPSWDASSLSFSQEIPRLWLLFEGTWIHPTPQSQPSYCNTHFNIILSSALINCELCPRIRESTVFVVI